MHSPAALCPILAVLLSTALLACGETPDPSADASTGEANTSTTAGLSETTFNATSTGETTTTGGTTTGDSSATLATEGSDESGSGTGSLGSSGASEDDSGGPVTQLEGLWQTEGYGWIYAIEGDGLKLYDVTSISCTHLIGGSVTELVDERGLEATATLEIPGLFKLNMEIFSGEDASHKHFLSDGLMFSPPAHRIDGLPAACSDEPDVDDVSIFDVVVASFADHYALFGDRPLDWAEHLEVQRARLTAEDPAPLFDVLVDLLTPLEDAHVSLQTPEGAFEGRRAEDEPVTEEMIAQAQTILAEDYLQEPLTRAVADQIGFARLSDELGYLAADGFGPLFTDDGTLDYRAGVAELDAFLDTILAETTMNALVIDLRNNGGGSDLYGLAIAARLTEDTYTPFSVRGRIDPEDMDVYSDPFDVVVDPSERPRFAGQVVVLIGRNTVSAAEVFALALRGRPGVTLIGEPSQGAFSSVLNHFLPNGWLLGLPNEHYVTPEGDRFDVGGLPPDVTTPVFTEEDIAAGRDSALDAAIALLTDASI